MKLRNTWIAIAAVVAACACTGVIYAVWSASGSGNGAARALTAKDLTVNAVVPAASAASLYPGGPAGWVYFTVTNPNSYPVTLAHIDWGTPVSNDTTDCPSANFAVDAGAPSTLSLSIPANSTSGALQVFSVLDLAHTAPDGCQGVAVTVPVSVTGAQS